MNNLFISQNAYRGKINNVTISYLGPYANDYEGDLQTDQKQITEHVFHVEFEKEVSYSIDPSVTPLFTIQFTLVYGKSGSPVRTTYTKSVYSTVGNRLENFVTSGATNRDWFFLVDLEVPYYNIKNLEIINPKITSIVDNSYTYKVTSGISKFVSIFYDFIYSNSSDFTLHRPSMIVSLLYGPTHVFQSKYFEIIEGTWYFGSNAILRNSLHDEYNDPISTSWYFGSSDSTNTGNRYIDCTMSLEVNNSSNAAFETAPETNDTITVYPNTAVDQEVWGPDLIISDINQVCWINTSAILQAEVLR